MRDFAFFALKLAISLALLYAAMRLTDMASLREGLRHLDYAWLVPALAALAVQLVLASLRWCRIARSCGASLTFRHALLYSLIGSFFSQTLPSTVGGDAARMWLMARDIGDWKSAIISVAIDRISGLIWLAVFVLVCLPWSLGLIHNPLGRTTLIVIGAAGALAPAGLYLLSWLGRTLLARWKATRHLGDIAALAWSALTAPSSGPVIAGLSILIHLLTVLAIWLCARAVDSPLTPLQALLLVPPVILIAAVPVSVAGWGVREGAMLTAFAYAGLPQSQGLLVSILFGIGSLIVGAFGGLTWSLRTNRVKLASIHEASERALDI